VYVCVCVYIYIYIERERETAFSTRRLLKYFQLSDKNFRDIQGIFIIVAVFQNSYGCLFHCFSRDSS
jgi:hypothetical protein